MIGWRMMNDNKDSDESAEIPQDDYVARMRPVPTEPPQRVRVLCGLLGDSDRSGHRRLYLSRSLDRYAEFASGDVLALDSIPPDQLPFVGTAATQVTLRRDAPVAFTYERHAGPIDEFDLDFRLGDAQRGMRAPFDVYTGDPNYCLPETMDPGQCEPDTYGRCAVSVGCPPDWTVYTVCKPYTCNGDVFSCAEGNTCVVC